MPSASVIITTYNSPRALDLVLAGYRQQQRRDFEVVIADDGSGAPTREVVRRHQRDSDIPILHVWQEDDGFQKCRILNKAILASRSDYLILTDGDCIPREDFVDTHLRLRTPGRYLSGALFRLSDAATAAITPADIASKAAFDPAWLAAHGQPKAFRDFWKLTRRPGLARFYEAISTAPGSWNGANSSCWKADAIAVNGFDERMTYGALDREFGVRLVHAGIEPRKIRYQAVVVHLEHKRSYNKDAGWERNRAIRAEAKRLKLIRAPQGIDRHTPDAIQIRTD